MPGNCNSDGTCTFLVALFLITLGILAGAVKYMWIPGMVASVLVLFYIWYSRKRNTAISTNEVYHDQSTSPSITTLPPSAVAIPAFVYDAATARSGEEGGGVEAVCSVCLEAVKGGEMVRKMPICEHVFHVECIDMWLGSHSTCPNCRSRVLLPPEDGTADDDSVPPLPPWSPV